MKSLSRLKQLGIALFLGVAAAIAAQISFTIPGIEGGVSDPREIIALSSVVMFSSWIFPLLVSVLAALGGPWDAMEVTMVMHVVAIPCAYAFYSFINKFNLDPLRFMFAWFVVVVTLYATAYSGSFVLVSYVQGTITANEIISSYMAFMEGVFFEATLTAVITSLLLALYRIHLKVLEQTEQLDMALYGTDLGLWDWNMKTDTSEYSSRWCSMLGYSPEEIQPYHSTWVNLIHPDDKSIVEKRLENHIDGTTDFFDSEHRLMTKEGSWLWVLCRGKIVERDTNGTPLRMAGTQLDINKRKNAEIENLQLQERLLQGQKLEAVGKLAGGIAHDFNNILTIISAQSQLNIIKATEAGKKPDDYHTIIEAVEKAQGLIKQLLSFSKKQKSEPKTVRLEVLVNSFETMLNRLIPEDIDLSIKITSSLPCIQADPTQVEQILINLIVNARDALNENDFDSLRAKKISIEIKPCTLTATFIPDALTFVPGEHVAIQVKDNGPGIAPGQRKKIFEPFYSTKEEGRGTGLGLSTVYGIVEQNHGCITIDSEKNHGTAFTIYWPVAEQVCPEEPKNKSEWKDEVGHETVLVVEDNSELKDLIISYLSGKGYTLLQSTNGSEALEEIKKHQDTIDLVISDVIMPVMDGMKLWDAACEIQPHLPFLFISGYNEVSIKARNPKSRYSYLQKPFSLEQLSMEVTKLLSK